MTDISEMAQYYKERAPVYDRVYQYPERQRDLRLLEPHIPVQFENKNVLEVAAGTGYWTQFIARTARSLVATDLTQATLDELMKRPGLPGNVTSRVVDAYKIGESFQARFNGAFIGLWLSHVPKQRIHNFLDSLHQCLKPGATVVMLDNSLAQCKRLPIVRHDDYGNSYQDRQLDSGETHRILKNFPTLDELRAWVGEDGEFQNYIDLENFWLFQYTLR
jgi:demethylmenaquinone methyltransferase/2-methoxy-6-polyprenyl-1,4-benzoquinol methylase